MKRLFYLMLMVLSTVAFSACSNGEETIVTMVTEGTSSVFFLLSDYQSFTITVDWGDGTIKRYSSETYIENHKLEDYESDQIVRPEHTYTDGKNSHTIKVCGSNIMKQTIYGFSCMDMQLTSLNINEAPSFMGIPVTSENEWSSLTHVDCSYNLLTSIRISDCPSLTVLNCGSNLLTSLDVSGYTDLKELSCRNNRLTSLDISKNRDLTKLNCEKNQLTSLNVGKNRDLTELNCRSNRLTSLDVRYTDLKELRCGNNRLTSLDISKNTTLTYLDCEDNRLTSLNIRHNRKLTKLLCSNNRLTTTAMNKIYETLPVDLLTSLLLARNKNKAQPVNIKPQGSIKCDKLGDWSIAEKKGWKVTFPDSK